MLSDRAHQLSTGQREAAPAEPDPGRPHAGPHPVAAAHRGGAPPPDRQRTRTRVGLLADAGDVRECHHVALLIGYGAAAVSPYLAVGSVEALARRGELDGISEQRRPPT